MRKPIQTASVASWRTLQRDLLFALGLMLNIQHVLWLLTTLINVVIMSNMNAELMLNERHILSENAFVEMVVWLLSSPLSKSQHGFKYRLALVVNGNCLLRYDNEAGKGDHKHMGEDEIPYIFTTPKALLEDFWNDVDNWRVLTCVP